MQNQPLASIARGGLAPLARLVWPVMVEQLLNMLVLLSDMFLAGQYLGQSHLAAMTSMGYVLWLFTNLFSVVAIGVTALVARFVGARDYGSATRAANQGLTLGAGMAVALVLIVWPWDDSIVRMMRLEGDSAQFFTRFLAILVPALPAMMIEQVGLAALRGAGDMVAGLLTMCLVNIVNLAVSWLLLSGVGPIPPQGLDGIAIGTTTGHVVGAIATLVLLARGRGGLGLRASELRPQRDPMRRILRVGMPGGVDVIGQCVLQLVFLSMINALGQQQATAAHGVAIRIESLSYLPAIAFQTAAGTLAGQYLGAGDPASAIRSARLACCAGMAVMLAASFGINLGSDWLPSLFVSDANADVSRAAAPLLRIVSLALVPLVILNVFNGALRGAGDTRWPLAITLIGFVGVRLPLAMWLMSPAVGEGVAGAWHAMAIDLYIRAILISARFVQGGWLRVRV